MTEFVKVCAIVGIFTLYFAINTLFFNDSTMHQIYEDKGSFNFFYQLPQIAYSSLISAVFGIIIKMLSLSQGQVLNFKKNKDNKDLEKKAISLNKQIKIRSIIYFILNSVFLVFLKIAVFE